MKKRIGPKWMGAMAAGCVLAFATSAQATLISQGPFNDGLGGTMDLIYDDDLDVTWLGNANFSGVKMTWDNAVAWASGLTVGGFTDWRLPTTPLVDAGCTNTTPGGLGVGTGCAGSEIGHLFYSELSGVAGQPILSSGDPDLGLFTGLASTFYWSGSEHAGGAVSINLDGGSQGVNVKGLSLRAWAVRGGNVVPEPGTETLAAAGLAVWAMRRRTQRS